MKFWLISLLATVVAVANVLAKEGDKCQDGGGVCTNKPGSNCKELQLDCDGDNKICCEQRRVMKDVKRICKGSRKCKKKGGKCIKKSATCSDVTDKKLCKGKQCTCCFPGCKCGEANAVRIVDGEEVSPRNKYPWMVGIAYASITPGYLCGGSIINDKYILTAAHCLYGLGSAAKPKELKVGLGDHLQLSTDDDIDGVTRFVKVDSYIIHPGYDFFGGHNDDIALIKLKKPLDLTAADEIRPVCLPKNNGNSYEGYDGIVAGWGQQDYYDGSSYPDELREVTVPIWDVGCTDYDSLEPITNKMLCAGYEEGGKDACSGDSGGPLVVNEDGVYTLVGIVSFGQGCAKPNTPGVYTRVSRYLKWIKANTKDASYCY